MAKLIINGNGIISTFSLLKDNSKNSSTNISLSAGSVFSSDSIGEIIVPATLANSNNVSVQPVYTEYAVIGVNQIEAQNNSSVTIKSNESPLRTISAIDKATIILNNNYIGAVASDICIGINSAIMLNGLNMRIGTVLLDKNAALWFTHNNTSFHVCNSNNSTNAAYTIIKNINKLAEIAHFINTKFNTKEAGTKIQLNESAKCKAYQSVDKSELSCFMQEHNMALPQEKIATYIIENYFTLTGVCKEFDNLGGSAFELPVEVIGNICSYLVLSDVILH